MKFEILNAENVESYLDYLKIAMAQEPDMMVAEKVDENGIRERVADEFYQRTTSILAFDGSKVVGRIEFHFYGCLQDGHRMAYVDWVYVLKDFRHREIAQALFQEFEKECEKHQKLDMTTPRLYIACFDKLHFTDNSELGYIQNCP